MAEKSGWSSGWSCMKKGLQLFVVMLVCWHYELSAQISKGCGKKKKKKNGKRFWALSKEKEKNAENKQKKKGGKNL